MSVLDYGLFRVHANGRIIGIAGFVIQTDAGETVLIDTGFPEKYATDAAAARAEDDLGEFGQVLSLGPTNLAPAQLALLGLGPDDVDLMIQSHTHIDHIGFMYAFQDAPIVIAAAERALPRPLYWSGKRPMDWPPGDYVTLTEDTEIGPGFHVYLVPGHTPGQLAFQITLPNTGTVLLTSDAISRLGELDDGFAGAWDEVHARTSGARLMKIAAEQDAMIIFGHCPEQWPRLRKAPEWYD
ncbi:MAG: MBL fold metallo-hydrolase [Pseudomonadota bacterium]